MEKHLRGEGVTRLLVLKFSSSVLDEFRNGKVMVSKQISFAGDPLTVLDYLDEELQEKVTLFQNETGHTVYSVIEIDGKYGFLFLDKNSEGWFKETMNCLHKTPTVYIDGEYKTVEVKKSYSGLKAA